MTKKPIIAILGAGAWGTAMAIHLARAHYTTLLWGRHAQHMQIMQDKKENVFYLPNIPFPPTLTPTDDLKYCCSTADLLGIAVPSAAFMSLIHQIPPPRSGLFWLTKGLDPFTHQTFHTLIQAQWGNTYPMAMLSGPSFAKEVASGLPTALTLAANDVVYQKHLQHHLHHGALRIYLSQDLLGVQLCSTLKNVLAIACGINDGLLLGANARAALITRGLSEMQRLGLKMGALPQTFTSLAGLGDLVLTCTDPQSRNYRLGKALAEGQSIQTVCAHIQQVIEGYHNAPIVMALAHQYHIELPICEAVYAVMYHHMTPQQAAQNLIQRKLPSDL